MPANYHQTYVATQIAALDPATVADMIANPPSGKALRVSAVEVHKMVLDHADDETKVAWGVLLDAAARQRKDPDWPVGWSLPISRMIFDLPAPDEDHGSGQRLEAVA